MARPRKAKASRRVDYFKYDPTVHGKDAFNIDLALNQNWDKTADELERQDGEIEKVKNSIESSMNSVVKVLPNQTGIDLNTINEPCEFYCQGVTNSPSSQHGYFKHEFHTNTANYAKQTYTIYNTGETWTRTRVEGTWSPWKLPNADTVDGKHATDFVDKTSTAAQVLKGGITLGNAEDGITTWRSFMTHRLAQGSKTDVSLGVGAAATGAIEVRRNSVVNTRVDIYDNDIFISGRGVYKNIDALQAKVAQGAVKSVQRGIGIAPTLQPEKIGPSYSLNYFDVTISAVDMNKSLVISNSVQENVNAWARLINSTTLRINIGNTNDGYAWQVVEYN